MAQTDYDLLVDMGFDPQRAKLAVDKTKGLQDAIDWLEKTQDTPIDELLASNPPQAVGGSSSSGEIGAKDEDGDQVEAAGVVASLKCSECGKLFSSQDKAAFHNTRTGHENFEESTEVIQPLTAEEKKAKLEELRKKLAEKRAAEAVAAREEQKKNEAIRRKKTQETEQLKEDLRRQQQLKEVEKRRREKIEDEQAKERVRQKIRETQEARRLQAERDKAAREGRSLPEAAPVTAAAPVEKKTIVNHSESRLQLRLQGQAPLVLTFPVETTLFEVASRIESERGFTPSSFTMTFPRKTFSGVDLGQTLKEAGMVPSCALIVE